MRRFHWPARLSLGSARPGTAAEFRQDFEPRVIPRPLIATLALVAAALLGLWVTLLTASPGAKPSAADARPAAVVTSAPTLEPVPTMVAAAPVSTRAPPEASPTPTLTLEPLGPAPGAVTQPLPLEMTVEFDPPVAHVGRQLVMKFGVSNRGERATEAIEIATRGPWDVYQVYQVTPEGTFGRDGSDWYIRSRIKIPPSGTDYVYVVAVPTGPGDQQFTFVPRAVADSNLDPGSTS